MRSGTKNPAAADFFDLAIQNPLAVFREPRDVVDDPRLTPTQKSDVLTNWAYDACELEVAEDEGMAGGVASNTDAVISALNLLPHSPASERTCPTKHAAPYFR